MGKMGKIMITVGLIWLLVGCIYGYNLAQLQNSFLNEMKTLTEKGDLVGFWKTFRAWKIKCILGHDHILCFSYILILTGLVMPYIRLGEALKAVLGVLLIIGAVMSPLFVLLFKYKPGMLVANVLIMAIILVYAIGALIGLVVKEESKG
ncbi:MAG: hypothetical protein HXY47_06260 [Nitrospirae bacterium]|nr:hypothetical protein [Nitrospirota bacterium]